MGFQCQTVRVEVTILPGSLWQASPNQEILALVLVFSERSGSPGGVSATRLPTRGKPGTQLLVLPRASFARTEADFVFSG